MPFAPGPLVAALGLAGVYALGGRIKADGPVPVRRRWVSLAAGASVAYVFVDVLPELGTRHRAFLAAAGEGLVAAEQRIYLVAFAGFVLFYGLEHMVLTARVRGREHAGRGAGDPVYWLEAGGFAVYSWLVGYLLVHRAEHGPVALLLYAIAMALHFFMVAHALREEHGAPYERAGRWILAASVLVGWVAGATTRLAEPWFARLFAFVAGGVVITSMKAELPREGEGQFWPFCLGAVAYAVLLLVA